MNNSSISRFSADYLVALRSHDEAGQGANLKVAAKLGKTAVEIGIGTLELAKIHDAALTRILASLPTGADELVTTNRATSFFNEALTPIEKIHRSALEAAAELDGIHTDLDQRTKDLAASQRQLARETEGRRSAEDTLRTSEETAAVLLVESRNLEEELRAMARGILSANEADRKQMSLHLHDDISQAMLGIHVRLLAVKASVDISHGDVAEQITGTERLLAQSVKAISSFASALDIDNED